jgi:hypothetical protein
MNKQLGNRLFSAQPFVENSDFTGEIKDPLPEGYTEALADCHTLAVSLLHIAINGEDIKRCWDCDSWIGRCQKGKPNRIAAVQACANFSTKNVSQ